MSNWSRKALGHFLMDEGYTLKTAKSRVGEWNESRDYYAVKGDREIWMGSVYPGDRPDWQGMWDYFRGKQPMFD